MKLQFKQQQFQLDAVNAVADVFKGQPRHESVHYMADPGKTSRPDLLEDLMLDAYRNALISLDESQIRDHVRQIQTAHHLKPSDSLTTEIVDGRIAYNLDIEMETGTGKTYTYIRTIMELHKRYGWLKFIVVVPSVAIREGVLKSFETMGDHFQQEYGTKPRYFVYDSKRLTDIDQFANSADLRVMIINSQAFNAKGADARRIRMALETFRYRKPIDVIAATHPILIIDEPQSVEGKKTKESLKEFEPLFTLRYSATHKTHHDLLYRLDAMDAYNQKLVKKIAVKTIEEVGSTGTSGYLRLLDVVPQKTGGPKARIEYDKISKSGKISRTERLASEPFDLYHESGGLEGYRDGFTLSHFDARNGGSIQVGPSHILHSGQVMGLENEEAIRRLQIKETIKSHLETESHLYHRGIKVLSLFFIDEVANYKAYDQENNSLNGPYATYFEEEYHRQVANYLATHKASSYRAYLERQQESSSVHAGYFSIDKVKKSDKTIFVDYKLDSERKKAQSDDQDAYDLIMRDKERLLSFDEPVRFIFSHSALKEGWDNPNVFQICTLKDSRAEIRKRQEIGRGMRLAVDQKGVRQDESLLGGDVHDINKLTVIANESYDSFTRSLQAEIQEELKDRPQIIDVQLFTDKVLENSNGDRLKVTDSLAREIQYDLIQRGYIDKDGHLTERYFTAKENNHIELSETFSGFTNEMIAILDMVYDGRGYPTENANKKRIRLGDEVNQENLSKKAFQELWSQINRKTSYRVSFDDEELIEKAKEAINDKLTVSTPEYHMTQASAAQMTEDGFGFEVKEEGSAPAKYRTPLSRVRYDLLGDIAAETNLTRKTVAEILSKIMPAKFDCFKRNPEEFIKKSANLINAEKATQIIEKIEYNVLEDRFDEAIFTGNDETVQEGDEELSKKGVYRYVKVDSEVEKKFNAKLDKGRDVEVYVKLPRAFVIPTPVGNYNPDWAIAFKEDNVKHIYFVAETKGSMDSMQLKGAEKAKIDCAKKHFQKLRDEGITKSDHIYDVVDTYEALLEKVKG